MDDLTELSALFRRGEDSLRVLQRQVVVQNLYHHQPYVIEQQLKLRPWTPRQQAVSSASSSLPAPPSAAASSLPGSMEDDQHSLHQQLTSFTSREGQNAMDMIDGSSSATQASKQQQQHSPSQSQSQSKPQQRQPAAQSAPRPVPTG